MLAIEAALLNRFLLLQISSASCLFVSLMVFRLTRYFFLISLLRAEAFWSQSVPQHNIGTNSRIYFKDFFLIFIEFVTILLLCFYVLFVFGQEECGILDP